MRDRGLTVALPLLSAACGLVVLHFVAPTYLFHQGFPLDDAWIHAVYARELARSGTLAYNPGIAATGETAPLWALILALAHSVGRSTWSAIALTKVLGFLLHAWSSALVAVATRPRVGRGELAWAAGAVVAFHPDLMAASVSGMEVPLATLVLAALILAVTRAKPMLVAVLGAAAFAARPETAVIAVAFGLLFWIRTHPRRAFQLGSAALAGATAALVLIGLRNNAVSGLLLPATFHAKTSVATSIDFARQEDGFVKLLEFIPLVDSVALLAALAIIAIVLVCRANTSAEGRAAGAMYLAGLGFCAVSFALVRPVDPASFYHQRYILPALVPIVAAQPFLARETIGLVARPVRVWLEVAVVILVGVTLVRAAPPRYERLSNDAHNIDDVQVAFGRALASLPPSTIAWVVDAGAPRFFGSAFVVDLMALNTPELLKPSAQRFLDDHPPRYLDQFPGWSNVSDTNAQLPERSFATSTPYTVTSFPSMQRHVLVSCEPPGLAGKLTVRERTYRFRCGH